MVERNGEIEPGPEDDRTRRDTRRLNVRPAGDVRRTGDGQSDERAERLRARARELGFDQVGIAPAETPDHADWFRAWIDRGSVSASSVWKSISSWLSNSPSAMSASIAPYCPSM